MAEKKSSRLEGVGGGHGGDTEEYNVLTVRTYLACLRIVTVFTTASAKRARRQMLEVSSKT